MNDESCVNSINERSFSDYSGRPKYRCHFGALVAQREHLTTLTGIPTLIGGGCYIDSNLLTSLKGIHIEVDQICGRFSAVNNPIRSHVLGLLLIEGITKIVLDN